MNSLVNDISNPDILVSVLLRRAKDLATKLNQSDFLAWLDKELNGYPKGGKYPDYRKLSGQVKFWNPYLGWCPVIFQSTKVEEQISKRYGRQSVVEIEGLLKANNHEFEMPYPADVANQIMTGAYLQTKVSLMISRTSLIGILNSVRNALQNWILDIQKKGIKLEDDEFSDSDQEKAKTVEPKYHIENIEKFQGNVGEGSSYQNPGIVIPKENFWTKFFWYVLVALGVVVIGNVISGLILKYWDKLILISSQIVHKLLTLYH